MKVTRRPFLIGALCIAGLGAACISIWGNGQASTFAQGPATPSKVVVEKNDHVASYVGREVCGECHQENFRLHGASGHASTLAKVVDSPIAQHFAGKTVDAGPGYGKYRYDLDDDGLWVSRLEDSENKRFPLQYVLGSGHNARTMFTLVDDDKGGSLGLEHRVSWFASHNDFGLTPGHANKSPTTDLETFGNPVRDEMMHGCIDCHSTRGEISGGEISGLVPNVNCEKCHGPGGEHVRQARLTDKPLPFSIGRSDWDQESELQLCGSCHRLPVNFSPRQLREYPSTLVRFQPVGMVRSDCYLQSEGKMSCTTCHNPHQSSFAKSKADYVADCLSCHEQGQEEQTHCPVSATDRCIECHMPALEFEQGMIFHDHWIRVRDDK